MYRTAVKHSINQQHQADVQVKKTIPKNVILPWRIQEWLGKNNNANTDAELQQRAQPRRPKLRGFNQDSDEHIKMPGQYCNYCFPRTMRF